MDEILKDDRFKHIAKDPRFRKIPRSQRKVKIDKRFQSMFEDKRFKLKYTVDKRGRPINRTSNEDLEKFYHLSGGSEDDETQSEDEKVKKSIRKEKRKMKENSKQLKNLPLKEVEEAPSTSRQMQKSKKDMRLGGMGMQSKKNRNMMVTDSEIDSESDIEEEDEQEDNDDDSGDDGSDEEDSECVRSDDETVTEDIKVKLKDMSVDYARGEGALLSDSSSDELSEDNEADEDDLVHGWGELDRDADRIEESTRRLALCNMDWDRIRATDIMVLFNSFVPPTGMIHSITVYPSEYGLERMKMEQERGPVELYGGSGEEFDEDNDDDKYQMEKLRQYQLNRLRYFYAIIECDSVATADHLYKECDGREYESSATRLDLRFVPDDTTFDQEPRESCTEMPDLRKYKPRNFLTTALQQSKVDMTWDETDPDRANLTSRLASGDIDDDDLKAYLASSTSDDTDGSVEERPKSMKRSAKKAPLAKEESGDENRLGSANEQDSGDENEIGDDENSDGSEDSDDSDTGVIDKYRRALQDNAEEEEKEEDKDVQMEITWDTGLKKAAEEAVKKKMEEKEERTPFQEMVHRRREKRKEKKRLKAGEKNEKDNSDSDASNDYIPADIDLNDPYFKEEYDNLEKGKKKKNKKNFEETEEDVEKKKWAKLNSLKKSRQNKTRRELEEEAAKESNFKVNVSDERFTALYTSHLYNIDPTDPNFRKTSGTDALITEKLQRRSKQDSRIFSEPPHKVARLENGNSRKISSESNSRDIDLSSLVKSVKSKAQSLQNSKKRKLKDSK